MFKFKSCIPPFSYCWLGDSTHYTWFCYCTHTRESHTSTALSLTHTHTWRALTHAHRTAEGVVDTAHVVHLAAVGGVVEDGGGEEAEVVHGPGDVHGAGERHRLPWDTEQERVVTLHPARFARDVTLTSFPFSRCFTHSSMDCKRDTLLMWLCCPTPRSGGIVVNEKPLVY